MVKSQAERDFQQQFKKPQPKQCHICGSVEPFGPEGKPVRWLRVAEGVWECNYCNNQRG